MSPSCDGRERRLKHLVIQHDNHKLGATLVHGATERGAEERHQLTREDQDRRGANARRVRLSGWSADGNESRHLIAADDCTTATYTSDTRVGERIETETDIGTAWAPHST
jgi:hypothetical protein